MSFRVVFAVVGGIDGPGVRTRLGDSGSMLIGTVIYALINFIGVVAVLKLVEQGKADWDYTYTILMFAGLGVLGLIFAVLLRRESQKEGQPDGMEPRGRGTVPHRPIFWYGGHRPRYLQAESAVMDAPG